MRAVVGLTLLVTAACASEAPRPAAPPPSTPPAEEPAGVEPGQARGPGHCAPLAARENGSPGEAKDAGKAQVEFDRGTDLLARGDHEAALVAFEAAVSADATHGLAHLRAAEAHLFTDNDVNAMRPLLARALLLLPENPAAHQRYAAVLDELEEDKLAEAHYRCALELRPDLRDAHLELTRHLLAKGRPADAEAQVNVVLKQTPDDTEAILLLADILDRAGRPLDAAQAVESAAKRIGKSAALYRRAANLYELAGNAGAARKARQEADRIDPPPPERKLRELPKRKS